MSEIRFIDCKDEWLRLRKSHITGTDVGAILGENPFNTKDDIIASKSDRRDDVVASNYLMDCGNKFEDYLAGNNTKWLKNGCYCSGNFMATTDFVSEDETILCELKTTLSEKRFEELCKVPKYILRQIQHQYICSGKKFKEVYLLVYQLKKGGYGVKKRRWIKINGLDDYTKEEQDILDDFHKKYIRFKG